MSLMPRPISLVAQGLLLLSLGAGLAPEARAAIETQAPPHASNPWGAAALSGLGMPVAAMGAAGLAGSIPGGGGSPLVGLMILAPVLTGSGQWYAGDWQRGAWVGLGGEAIVLGTMLGLGLTAKPGDTGAGLAMGLAGIAAGTLYSVWAGYDAFQTSQRMSKATATPQP